MTKHEQHMKLIDNVNNAKTRHEHSAAYWTLHGWREGMSFAGNDVDLCAADLTQMDRGHANRNMTCGIFHDWKPQDSKDNHVSLFDSLHAESLEELKNAKPSNDQAER